MIRALSLIEAIPIARALWGRGLADALAKLNRQFWRIECYAEESIDHLYTPEESERTKVIQMELGQHSDDPANEITTNIEAAMVEIEAACASTLRDEAEELKIDPPEAA